MLKRMEIEPHNPMKKSSDRRFDDNEGVDSSCPSVMLVTLRISADKYMKPVIESM